MEIRSASPGMAAAWITCPPGAVPGAGQFLRAYAPGDETQALSAQVFAAEIEINGFLAPPPIPTSWLPGTQLSLYGPLGSGFRLGTGIRRLALAALGDSPARLLPLIPQALGQGADITFLTDCLLPDLPASVEISPLSAMPDLLEWADFLAMDLSRQTLPDLRRILGLRSEEHLPFPAQALVSTAMPCAGLAECGACAVPGCRGWKLACKDGPVFDLDELEW
jgi:dihydroorotate dehydrogenase electron transfer subunit